MTVRFTPKSFADAFTTGFTKAVTDAAGKDGRLTKAEAQKIAGPFTDDALSFFEASGQKSVSVSKLIGQQRDAVLASATAAAGADGQLSATDAQKLAPQYRDDFQVLRAGPTSTGPSLADLKAKIDAATDGLWLTSESNAKVEFVSAAGIGSQPITEALVRSTLAAQHDALGPDLYGSHDASFVKLADRSLDRQSDGKAWLDRQATNFDPNDPASVAQAQKWAALRDTLTANLSDLQVFRFGSVNITTLVIGRTTQGDLAGVLSAVVET